VCVLVRERVVHAQKKGRKSDFLGGGEEIKATETSINTWNEYCTQPMRSFPRSVVNESINKKRLLDYEAAVCIKNNPL